MGRKSIAWRIMALVAVLALVVAACGDGDATDGTDGTDDTSAPGSTADGGASGDIPNPDVLLAPLTTQEAVLSSRIEGTQATFDEVLAYEAEGRTTETGEREADIQEVLNYRAALRRAVEMMATLPLSQRVVKEAHRVLMDGVRGQNKTPGEYRRIANWIGPAGAFKSSSLYFWTTIGKTA